MVSPLFFINLKEVLILENVITLILNIFADTLKTFLPVLGLLSGLNFIMTFLFTVMYRGSGEAGRPRL